MPAPCGHFAKSLPAPTGSRSLVNPPAVPCSCVAPPPLATARATPPWSGSFPGLSRSRLCRAPLVQSLLDLLLNTLLRWFVVTLLCPKVILGHEMVRMIVRVLVSLAVAEAFRAFVVRVPQMLRHGQRAAGLNVLQRRVDRRNARVALVRRGVGKPRVSRRSDHQAPRDEARIFPRVDHLRQPVKRSIRIAAAHRLDVSRDGVVMRITAAIVDNRLLLDALRRDIDSDVNETV